MIVFGGFRNLGKFYLTIRATVRGGGGKSRIWSPNGKEETLNKVYVWHWEKRHLKCLTIGIAQALTNLSSYDEELLFFFTLASLAILLTFPVGSSARGRMREGKKGGLQPKIKTDSTPILSSSYPLSSASSIFLSNICYFFSWTKISHVYSRKFRNMRIKKYIWSEIWTVFDKFKNTGRELKS